MLNDLRYGLRMLAKNPGFSAVAVLTLTLGIGATTAIFSVVNGVLLQPLPYSDPGQLVRIFTVFPSEPKFPVSRADFLDLRARNHVFSDFALFAQRDLDLMTQTQPERLTGMGVSSGFLHVLGIQPLFGRDFVPEDEREGRGQVAILSYQLWQRRFHSDPAVVGRAVLLSREQYTVVGVMPAGVQHVGGSYQSVAHGDTVDIWHPLVLEPGKVERGAHFLNGVARLKPAVTPEQAQAELHMLAAQLERDYPDTNKDARFRLVALKEEIVGGVRPLLLVLMATVGFVLLIACVNVANLMLSRAAVRQREIAVRSVLGAGRWRLARQLLTESVVTALLGGGSGILLAYGAIHGLRALGPEKLPRLQAVALDGRVLAFTLATTLLTGMLFGLAPVLAAWRTNPNDSLKEGERGLGGGRARRHLQNFLVTAEISLALILLVGAGLLMRTFVNLDHVERGFRADHVLTFSLDLPSARYPDNKSMALFYNRLLERLRRVPGVTRVGAGSDLPWDGYDENTSFDIQGYTAAPNEDISARYHFATQGYFEAIGTPLIHGRFFSAADNADAPMAVMVNAAFARRFFPRADELGKHLRLWGKDATIVGVVGDVKDSPVEVEAKPALYWEESQLRIGNMRIVLRTSMEPEGMAATVRREIGGVDPELPVTHVRPLEDLAMTALAGARFAALLFGVFAGVALLLAAIGVYGLMHHSVTQRTHEIGIRIALGAQRRDVLGLIVGRGMVLAVIGLGIGLAGALALIRLLSSLLFGVTPTDPATLVCVSLLLMVVAMLACYIPARRATKVDPMIALRYE